MQHPPPGKQHLKNYGRFGLTMLISFVTMYLVMFFNVADTGHIYISLNRFYMTSLMVAPMALIMLGMMGQMYPSRKWNATIALAAVAVLALAFSGLRNQTLVSDVQYMKGMIPHHSSAILTSTQANLKDPEVQKLAKDIIATQEKEIAQMKAAIQRLEGR